jgi:hypothetical protein
MVGVSSCDGHSCLARDNNGGVSFQLAILSDPSANLASWKLIPPLIMPVLRQERFNNVAVNVRQTEISTLVSEDEPFMVDAQQM